MDHIIQRSRNFLTSYTPYQPEIAQGTLQYLFEFQTQVAALTGMEVASAPRCTTGSTAAAEAVLMATRVTKRSKAVLSGGLHPHYVATIHTSTGVAGIAVVDQPPAVDAEADVIAAIDADTACVVVQTPNIFRNRHATTAHRRGRPRRRRLLIVVVTEVVSLGLLKSPGAMGGDIVVGRGPVDRQPP